MDFSIVEYYAEHEGYRCGYCKSTDTNYSHGMWAHTMTVHDYQDLIDRGWRRSGMYCYKPTMDRTCCPMYTIRCAARELKLSKSQKKVLKRMNGFLCRGETKVDRSSSANKTSRMEVSYDVDVKNHRAMQVEKSSAETKVISMDESVHRSIKPVRNEGDALLCSEVDQAVSSQESDAPSKEKTVGRAGESSERNKLRPLRRKAKLLRLERKREKLMARGHSPEEVEQLIRSRKRPANNQGKTLEQFLEEAVVPNSAHTLEVRLVRSQPPSVELQQTAEESHRLYVKYQGTVHHDPPDKCGQHQYTRFLVRSPLQVVLVAVSSREFECSVTASHALFVKYQMCVHGEEEDGCTLSSFNEFLVTSPLTPWKPSDGPASGYGSFHQQYWLDGKLIAVGVIDILPRCVSSVYFYYDPELSQLSLGTYASLRELAFTRTLSQAAPVLQYYYMGFYIHSCPKMRYKASYTPSFLLCPETYQWHPVYRCCPKLDQQKYNRFCEDPAATDPHGNITLGQVLVLRKDTAMRFSAYVIQCAPDPDNVHEVEHYARLVGMACARRMLLLRP